jgi:AraC-like DNA-binding protein
LSARQVLEALERSVPGAVTWIVSCFPRGSAQAIQPARVPHSFLRHYVREYHTEDRATWQAIKHHKAVTEHDAWSGAGGFEQSRFYRELMLPSEFCHLAAAPLANPLLPGYPGALQVYRTADQGTFSSSELSHLTRAAKQIDQAAEASHPAWQNRTTGWSFLHRPAVRQWVFDGHGKAVFGESALNGVEDRVRDQMLRHVKQVLGRINGQAYSNDRICLPDTRGDLWVFRAVTYLKFPALGDGPFVFICMQPDCKEWSAIRASDVSADQELSRLVPAMQFMHREFGHGVTLNDIAKSVELSPFHFHRRFTELFGITPKHFLLECQINNAKSHIAAGDKTLVEIANSCGFAHQSHFTSRFKQASGLTPTGWRKMADEQRSMR